jgi:DNA topoisomerase-2
MATNKKITLKKSEKLNTQDEGLAKKYQKLTQLQHILARSGMYIGQTQMISENRWVLENNKMLFKNSTYSPGLYKIIDEIVVNAWDQFIRNKNNKNGAEKVTQIDINVDEQTGLVSILNDGKGVEVAIHPVEKIYIPELIFGKLMSGSNFEDDDDKVTGGMNGLGAKLTSVFSTTFKVETLDLSTKLRYEQTFEKNMSVRNEPILTKLKKGEEKKEYTRISFIPDFPKFNMKNMTPEMVNIIHKRALEVSACCGSEVKVRFNGETIKENTFEKFCSLFLSGDSQGEPSKLVYEKCGERWQVGAAISDGFQQISYVNGIYTSKGGKHVDYVTNAICKKLADILLKKHKITVKPANIREHLFIFVNCLVVNSTFDSQTKDFLTTPIAKLGSKCEISDKFIDKLAKAGVIESIIETYNFKESKLLKKTDGRKKNKIYGIPKLDDANEAGGKKSNDCTLILTEGDSAKAMAVAGLSVVGRDTFGVFPLRGKVINVREKMLSKQGRTQVMANVELNHMKQILGLEQDVKYKNTDKLRYGHIMIMTDQDVDGSHIKGLIMNWLAAFWPELLEIKGFIQCMLTPIVKVSRKKQSINFYSLQDYEAWKLEIGDYSRLGWSSKYYKGLGTSTTQEAKEYFKDLMITTYVSNEFTTNSLDMAFNKDRANDRKVWLKSYKQENVLNPRDKEIGFDDFVHKELIHFSNYDLQRSIPNIMDGLKPSQRKILFACFKRHLTKEIRVAQLAGYVSEHAGYHHGEESLNKAIIAMAQNFTGSNNINVLQPNGQFGTRTLGGKDAGSPRYLHTALANITFKLFNEDDAKILNYLNDDGIPIEPEFYIPVIPMILCNGAQGIGTGYSTSIPSYSPIDVLKYVEYRVKENNGDSSLGEKPKLTPFYNGFKGKIVDIGDGSYLTKGVYKILNYKTILISELPIGVWIDNYKAWLDEIMVEQTSGIKKTDSKNKDDWSFIKNYKSQSTESTPHFEIEIDPVVLSSFILKLSTKSEQGDVNFLEKMFKLTSKISTSNMHLYSTNGAVKKFNTVYEIADEFIACRGPLYKTRKDYILNKIGREMTTLENKVRFIRAVVDTKIDVRAHTKKTLCEYLFQNKYDKYSKSSDNVTDNENNDSDEIDANHDVDGYVPSDYTYLTSISILQFTKDQVQAIEKTLADKSNEYNKILETTTSQMWSKDLNLLSDSLLDVDVSTLKQKSAKKIKLKK